MDREFRKGNENLLKKAVGRVCSDFRTLFRRDYNVPIYRDRNGIIAIPITDGYESFYIVAKKYLLYDRIASIERNLVIDALKRKMRFLFYVDELEQWYVFDPIDIIKPGVSQSSYRGDVEYLDFDISIRKHYQVRLFEPKRVK